MNNTKLKDITVSVIMITYGHQKYIKQAVEGVLMQECDFEIELIIANDCSPDGTDFEVNNIIQSHTRSHRINYINRDSNVGANQNYILALQQAKGNYIANCEGDDYWTDQYKLQKQVDFLKNNEEYVLCFHKVEFEMPTGAFVEDFLTKVPESHQEITDLANYGNYLHTPSVVFKNVLREFPPQFFITPIGDYFLYVLLADLGKIKYLEDKMAVYRYGVGFYSSFDSEIKNKKWLKTLLLLATATKNEKVKEILIYKICNYFKLDEFQIQDVSKIQDPPNLLLKFKISIIPFIPPIFITLKNKFFYK